MTSRFFTPQPLTQDQQFELDANVSSHLIKVLRHAEGDQIVLFNGDGFNYSATLVKASKRATVTIDEKLEGIAASSLKLTLIQGVSRGDRMDFSIQKAVELGVDCIQPVFCEKNKVRLNGDRLSKKMQHWKAVAISACEQCGRSDIPTLLDPAILGKLLEKKPEHPSLVLAFGQHPDLVKAATKATEVQSKEISILIGPESGLSESELEQAISSGWIPCQLGPRILRTETATVTALAVIQHAIGDLCQPPL